MEQLIQQKSPDFVDRRGESSSNRDDGPERRQFSNSYASMDQGVKELAEAIDRYKLQHRRRFITFEELHGVITSLGYHK